MVKKVVGESGMLTASRLRSQHRDHNRLVVDLDAPLSVLDVEFRPEEVCGAPATGRVIMRLDRMSSIKAGGEGDVDANG